MSLRSTTTYEELIFKFLKKETDFCFAAPIQSSNSKINRCWIGWVRFGLNEIKHILVGTYMLLLKKLIDITTNVKLTISFTF